LTGDVAPFDLVVRAAEALQVERAAMASSTGLAVPDDRAEVYATHAARPCYRAVAATDDEGRLVGFGYGYQEARGGWWDSHVRPRMAAVGLEHLLDDAWTVVELHVLPERQGGGLGRRLLEALVDGLAHPRVQLSTQRDANPARGFYDRLGFAELTTVPFPGLPPYVVLGRTLPLAAPPAGGRTT
jgi:ribosomal protein S18 acetylase RimI-like enzyme